MASTTGRCLCGAVTFRFDAAPTRVGVCHCGMCRREHGGPSMGLHDAGPATIEGEVRWWRSSDWAERGFCPNCGASLFWRMGEEIIPSAGALDDQSGLVVDGHVFIDDKPEWYDFADDAPRMTGAEAIAMFAPKEE